MAERRPALPSDLGASGRRRLGRPPASDGAETRARIAAAARVCFAEQGYGATTNRAIAEAAGITTGAIYHYFGSKQELYEAVFSEVEELVSARLSAARDAAPPRFADQLRALLEESVLLNREDSSLARFIVTVPTDVRRHPALAALLGQLTAHHEDLLGPVVDGARQRGELPDDVGRGAVLGVLAVVLTGLVEISANLANPEQHARNAEAVIRLFEGRLLREVGAVSAAG